MEKREKEEDEDENSFHHSLSLNDRREVLDSSVEPRVT